MQKYQQLTTRVMSWKEIEEKYIDLIAYGWELENMLGLVKSIQQEAFAERIYGFVSMMSYETLIVSIYNPIDLHRETLHVSFDSKRKRWHFEYHPKHHLPIEMERYYGEEIGMLKFRQFIDWLKW